MEGRCGDFSFFASCEDTIVAVTLYVECVILCLLTLAQSDRSSLQCLGFVVHVVLGSLRSAMLKYKVCDMSEHVYG